MCESNVPHLRVTHAFVRFRDPSKHARARAFLESEGVYVTSDKSRMSEVDLIYVDSSVLRHDKHIERGIRAAATGDYYPVVVIDPGIEAYLFGFEEGIVESGGVELSTRECHMVEALYYCGPIRKHV